MNPTKKAAARPHLYLVPPPKKRDLGEAYRELFKPLCKFAYGILRNRADAEDEVQDAFMSALAAGHLVDPDGDDLEAWLKSSILAGCLAQLADDDPRVPRLRKLWLALIPPGPGEPEDEVA